MEHAPRVDTTPVFKFAEDSVSRLERALLADNEYMFDESVRLIRDDLFLTRPRDAGWVYVRLAESPLKLVRDLATVKIREAFKSNPKLGGAAWNQLLNDIDPEIVATAYVEYESFVDDIEKSKEADWDLSPIYGAKPGELDQEISQKVYTP